MMSVEILPEFLNIELHPSDFDRYIPEFLFNHATLLECAKEYWTACNDQLKKLHDQHYNASHLIGLRSKMVDRLVTFLFGEAEKEVIKTTKHHGPYLSVLAQGGYGREEMNYYSDVDLLFVYPKKKGAYVEGVTEKILYVLWDLGLDVGHAIRTLPECKKLAQDDITIMSSLLDVRYICGREDQAQQFILGISTFIRQSQLAKKFIQQKIKERENRVLKNGGSVFVLEPNIKECAGGLRDIQYAQWIGKLNGYTGSFEEFVGLDIISQDEVNILLQARNFLWRLRNELHFMVGKKVDLLTFHRQEAIAPRMGYTAGENGILAVEKFMQTYYHLAYSVATITDKIVRQLTSDEPGLARIFQKFKAKKLDADFRIIDDQIRVKHRDVFEQRPETMMTLFEHIQRTGLKVHAATLDHIRSLIYKVDELYRTNPDLIYRFRAMLGEYKHLGAVLFAMHESHFLENWMPEFKKLRCRVQHDSYHIYTIDTHSIFAVNELSKLALGEYKGKFDVYEEVLKEVARPELLTLGLFLHDIGKGEGGNHSEKGAVIAASVTDRLRFSDEEKKVIEFLIRSHLMMPHLSQRRDLEDVELIHQFARSMASMDQLNMLFLLTWGDIRAVGPEAWTDWKGALLERLYTKTKDVITRGEFSKEKTLERVARVKDLVLDKMGNKYLRDDFQKFLSTMPPRYFFAMDEEAIERHFVLRSSLKDQSMLVDFVPSQKRAFSELTILALNTPQFFSRTTGVMLANSINILGVEVFQSSDGYVWLVLQITDAKGLLIQDTNFLPRVTEQLKVVFNGKVNVEDLIQKNKLPDYLLKKPVQQAPTKVVVDNDVSIHYTVIDIYTHDRLGLLYDISRTLHEQGCYVEISKISTKVEQVTDVFYVKDIFGHKITSRDKTKAIKNALTAMLEGPAPQV